MLNVFTEVRAYALIQVPDIAQTVEILGCPEHGPIISRFCPKCGQARQKVSRVFHQAPQVNEWLPNEMMDAVYQPEGIEGLPPNTILIIGNRNNVADGVDGECVEITFATISGCLTEFNTHYADVLKIIRDNAQSVEVKFGLVTYVM